MIRFAKLKRMISSFLGEITSIGGVTQNRMLSVKGIYSKGKKDENALMIPLLEGNNQDVFFVLQKEKDLKDGDVIVTDDKSSIHFKYDGEKIQIKTKGFVVDSDELSFNTKTKINVKGNEITIDAPKELVVNCNNIKFIGDKLEFAGTTVDFKATSIKTTGSITNNKIPIGSTHTHSTTSPPGSPTGTPVPLPEIPKGG